MRTIKDPEERRHEILDAAEALFMTKGYEKTTVHDILNEIGIAKGTFYYYFKSKEELLDAMVIRMVDIGVKAASAIAADTTLTVHEKFLRVILAQKPDSSAKLQLIDELHHVDNARLHQRSLSETVLRLTPVLQEVVEQGIHEGLFSTPYPKESIEFLLTTAVTVFDDGIFEWPPEEMVDKIQAFIYAMETLLGADPGSFAYVAGVFG